MSRTIRRKRDIWEQRYYVNSVYRWAAYSAAYGKPQAESVTAAEAATAARDYHLDSRRCMTTPSWWVNLMMTRAQRQETRLLLQKLHTLAYLEDTPLFPHQKRPHHYYW
jgi:hypothetical protein